MRQNIDLTSNQMFSRYAQPATIQGFIRGIFGTKFPWDIPWSRTAGEKFEAVKTGDRYERKIKKLCDDEISKNYCDRCGAHLVTIPWNRTYGLCQKCHSELNKELGFEHVIPWILKKDSSVNRDATILNW